MLPVAPSWSTKTVRLHITRVQKGAKRSGKHFSDKQIIVRLFPHSFSRKKYADISFPISNHPHTVLAF